MGVEQVLADAARVRRELMLMYWVRESWPAIESLLRDVSALDAAMLPEPLRGLPARASGILVAVSKKGD